MGNCCISKDIKEITLKLWDQGWEAEDICDTLGISCASLYQWQVIFAEHGSVNHPLSPLKGQGLCILTCTLIQACQGLFSQELDLFLDEVKTWLTLEHDIVISTLTLAHNLTEIGLTCKILHKIAAERDEECHGDFWEQIIANFQGDSCEFMFMDETSKDEHTWACHYGHAMSGARVPLSDVLIQGDWYSLVAAMTVNGYIAAEVMEGSYDHDLFCDFITQQLLPTMNPFPAERSVIVLDNCCIHHNEDIEAAVWEAGKYNLHFVSSLIYPPQDVFSCSCLHIPQIST
ncbi:hypothetical protein M404DRAFT_164779 [Pisolithus tinctorius Marx 270]|uniref:Tc1-like transposase DDE domain-containing protein n=1 Tax=Pisolithus tinctorius Marx 270 TaxID=870435 RepID=A0A0C3NKS4_PISTI|nr:hypothetical protein M404DRAFT_164779 [Pisolithus tinctorius Marx 270]